MVFSTAEQRHRRSERASDLFGHPRGLTFLFATEMWERFSYYGMRALLVLYMVRLLLLPGHVENVIGLSALKYLLESIFGPLGVQPFASQVYGLYTGLVYLTPVFGGMLADRVLGQHRTILLGAAMMALGHFMMAFEPLFLIALTMLILGNGAFKPNMSAQVGGLYAPGDPRRDRAYSIFYVGINLGAFLAPLVCGTLGERVGWHYGFDAAGVGMLIGLCIYLYALPLLPADELHRAQSAQAARQAANGRSGTLCRGRQSELAVAVRLLRRHHARRAISVAGRVVVRHQDRAGAADLAADGRVAFGKFHWRLPRRLHRQLLEPDGQA